MLNRIVIYLFIFVVISFAQSTTVVELSWDYDDPDSTVEHFISYMWEGSDTNDYHIDSMSIIDTTTYYVDTTAYSVIDTVTRYRYIKGACLAQDTSGTRSDTSYSQFYWVESYFKKLDVINVTEN